MGNSGNYWRVDGGTVAKERRTNYWRVEEGTIGGLAEALSEGKGGIVEGYMEQVFEGK